MLSVVLMAQEPYALGYRPTGRKLQSEEPLAFTAEELSFQKFYSLCLTSTVLPEKFDLRDEGGVTSVKNQNPYGTCWIFAALASYESCLLRMRDERADFSEWNVAMRSDYTLDRLNAGGNDMMAYAILSKALGPVAEQQDPYLYTATAPFTRREIPAVRTCVDVDLLDSKTDSMDTAHESIKRTIYEKGAVATSMYYDNAYCNGSAYYYNGSSSTSNHAVTIVGWDDTYDTSHFKTMPPGNGAYIIKNSWGTAYGDNGYFYVSYYDTALGYSDNSVFYPPATAVSYTRSYQYDDYGWLFNSIPFSSSKSAIAISNIFTAQADETLSAVSFLTCNSSVSYTITVYTGCGSTSPTGGQKMCSQSGTMTAMGYHAVALQTPVALTKDQRFSIVVTFNNTSNYSTFYVPVETAVTGITPTTIVGTNESFINTGYRWYACSYNCCLRGLTTTTESTTTLSFYDWLESQGYVTTGTDGVKDFVQSATTQKLTLESLSMSEAFLIGSDESMSSSLQAEIEVVEGDPIVSWTPNLSGRVYSVFGKKTLTDTTWSEDLSEKYFFKVKVDWPTQEVN